MGSSDSNPPEGGEFPLFAKDEIEQTIAQRFHKQVIRYPDRIAIESAPHALTYSALDKRANQVAHLILEKDFNRSKPIALFLRPGIDQIVGVLGVLKSGGFYVPLDPALPDARLMALIGNTGTTLSLAHQDLIERMSGLLGARVSIVPLESAHNRPTIEVASTATPDSLAYVLYTSGSTGVPKGVFQNQRGFLHNVMVYANSFGIGAQDRQSFLYSYAVMGGTRDIFNALLNGGCLCHFPAAEIGLGGLAGWMVDSRLTIYCSVTTVARHLVQSVPDGTRFPTLRVVKLGGEPSTKSDIERFRILVSSRCRIHCGLATTETGAALEFWVARDTVLEKETIPLGYAVPDMTVMLLDADRAPVASGEIGEIAIRSQYVALGYWNDVLRTAEHFLTIPDASGERLYLTGDLGYFRSDGCLEHRGRKDYQVKIRGNRVEILEVESALNALPVIMQATVCAIRAANNEFRLVAHVVPAPGQQVSLPVIRQLLSRSLPRFMLPEAVVILDAFPRLPNEKIDRKALQIPSEPEGKVIQAVVGSNQEITLSELWARSLGFGEFGVDDNYFDLGGNSLKAGQMVAHIEERFKIHISVRELFDNPTISRLVQLINQKVTAPAHTQSGLVKVPRGNFLRQKATDK